ncbi:MAG TPA: RtcB family protein [Acidobacteriota bacterium]|nr:RtcB family protein [Acidobacteriota bacterium]
MSEDYPSKASYRKWGENLDPMSIEQMDKACRLPVSVRGALMPDCHVGYGLPIGGVLATENAVIPYAVGVDIACRMRLSVLDLPTNLLDKPRKLERLKRAIEEETRFGVGATFEKGKRRRHPVMDEDWAISKVTRENKDKAWAQLGTSGSGNHFVEFGLLTLDEPDLGLQPGQYLAFLSHSGSRGPGALTAGHYSRLARDLHSELPKELSHLSWLDLGSQEGQEYWKAMQLMGKYASANHACIHRHVLEHLGAEAIAGVENHHNFAWLEEHDGKQVVVHRKGATPAGEGVLGVIPGSMASPGYVVRGKGNEAALQSAAHGAGRVMSRTQAKKKLRWRDAKDLLNRQGVTLMSAGLDEVPMVYKNIDEVMGAQSDLVDVVARFDPKLVKMSPGGPAED